MVTRVYLAMVESPDIGLYTRVDCVRFLLVVEALPINLRITHTDPEAGFLPPD